MRKIYSLTGKRVWVAGHRGMVGSAIVRRLKTEQCEVLVAPRAEVDLRRLDQVEAWMGEHRPQAIFLAAAKVGGIVANDTYPADFLLENLEIESNVIGSAHHFRTEKLLFLGSSCIYPRMAEQPIREESLLTGLLEPTNEWYAIAKIAGVKLCQAFRRQYNADFISAMPTNLYGPHDNFDLATSHVLPALIRKAHEAKVRGETSLPIWGTGNARREFLHVDDCADALVYLIEHFSGPEPLNVGVGKDVTIKDLAQMICGVVGYSGELEFDPSRPDGTPRKQLDVARLSEMGWHAQIGLRDGLESVYRWYQDNGLVRAGD